MSPLRLKHPAHGAVFGHVAAVLVHHVADFADDAVAVGGDHFDDHAHAARAVALEIHLVVLLAFERSGAARQRSLDIVVRHVFIFGGQNRGAQARIGIRIAAAHTGSNGDFANQFGEYAAALGVSSRFFVLDCSPLRMPGHVNRLLGNKLGDESLLIATTV